MTGLGRAPSAGLWERMRAPIPQPTTSEQTTHDENGTHAKVANPTMKRFLIQRQRQQEAAEFTSSWLEIEVAAGGCASVFARRSENSAKFTSLSPLPPSLGHSILLQASVSRGGTKYPLRRRVRRLSV